MRTVILPFSVADGTQDVRVSTIFSYCGAELISSTEMSTSLSICLSRSTTSLRQYSAKSDVGGFELPLLGV